MKTENRKCVKVVAFKTALKANIFFENMIIYYELLKQRSWVYVTNWNFLTPIFLQPNIVDISNMNSARFNNLCLKYQMFT